MSWLAFELSVDRLIAGTMLSPVEPACRYRPSCFSRARGTALPFTLAEWLLTA